MHPMDRGAVALAADLAAGRIAPSQVMAAHLDRVASRNPALNALVSARDPDELMAEARALDGTAPTGPLWGLPLAVKDLVAVRGMRTTWGSPLFADFVAPSDDLVAARMRAAGAVFVAKTNTPEWGHGSHTFNPVFGATRNPYDPGRSAGGSSGGAAAALAARLVPLADGSDMMGSLRNPAAFCNIYGFRPTWGLIPGQPPAEAFVATLATEGPMARDVADLALLLDVLAGPSPLMPFGLPGQGFSARLDRDVGGLRIGWLGDWGGAFPCEPGILDLCRSGLAVFEGLGAIVEDVAPPFSAAELWDSWITLRAFLNAGAKRALWDDPVRRAALKPESAWEIEQGQTLAAAAVYRASETRSRWFARAARLFGDYDALVLPSAQVWPFPVDWRWPQRIGDVEMDTYHRWMQVVVPVSLAGLPCLACPAGFGPQGLPMGFQLFGASGSDAAVLALGQAYHRATDWPGRQPPYPSG